MLGQGLQGSGEKVIQMKSKKSLERDEQTNEQINYPNYLVITTMQLQEQQEKIGSFGQTNLTCEYDSRETKRNIFVP